MVASDCSLISCSENYILHFFFLFFPKGEEVSELVFLMLLQTINIFVILKSFLYFSLVIGKLCYNILKYLWTVKVGMQWYSISKLALINMKRKIVTVTLQLNTFICWKLRVGSRMIKNFKTFMEKSEKVTAVLWGSCFKFILVSSTLFSRYFMTTPKTKKNPCWVDKTLQ